MLHTPNSTRDFNFLLCRTGHAPVEEWELEAGNVKSMEMMAKQRANTAEFLGAGKRLHALVVGGTGMLRGLTLALAGKGYMVSVIARDATRLRALADAAAGLPGGVNPLLPGSSRAAACLAACFTCGGAPRLTPRKRPSSRLLGWKTALMSGTAR